MTRSALLAALLALALTACGEKAAEDTSSFKVYYPAWKWTNEQYVIESDRKLADISVAEIDASQRMADTERQNNRIKL